MVSAASSGLKSTADGVAQAAVPLAVNLGALRVAADGVTAASNQLRETSEAERQAAGFPEKRVRGRAACLRRASKLPLRRSPGQRARNREMCW